MKKIFLFVAFFCVAMACMDICMFYARKIGAYFDF